MKLDTRLTSSALTLALAAVVIPFTADWQLPLLTAWWSDGLKTDKRYGYCLGRYLPPGIYGHFPVPKGQSSFGYGLLSGGWCYWVEAPVGGVTISLTSRVCCSERFQ